MGLLNFLRKDGKLNKASADIDEVKTLFNTSLGERNSKYYSCNMIKMKE